MDRMGRVGSVVLVLALLGGVVWATRQARSDAPALDRNWLTANQKPLRRVLNLVPTMTLEFKEVSASPMPDHYLVSVEAVVGADRYPLALTVSRDGRRLLYEGRVYDLDDPFGSIRNYIKLEGAPARGPANAPVTVVEYTDYTCVYCRQFFLTQEEPLFKRFEGKVRLVYKHFPLVSLRAWSEDAALAAACAFRQGNDKFWPYHNRLFREAPRLKQGKAVFVELARETGLNPADFSSCYDKRDAMGEVNRDLQEGEHLGVSGTPNFFVNGRPVAGLMRTDFFFEIVNQELAAAEKR